MVLAITISTSTPKSPAGPRTSITRPTPFSSPSGNSQNLHVHNHSIQFPRESRVDAHGAMRSRLLRTRRVSIPLRDFDPLADAFVVRENENSLAAHAEFLLHLRVARASGFDDFAVRAAIRKNPCNADHDTVPVHRRLAASGGMKMSPRIPSSGYRRSGSRNRPVHARRPAANSMLPTCPPRRCPGRHTRPARRRGSRAQRHGTRRPAQPALELPVRDSPRNPQFPQQVAAGRTRVRAISRAMRSSKSGCRPMARLVEHGPIEIPCR